MTKERVLNLLKIEHECVRRNQKQKCERQCESCDLAQTFEDLDEMYEVLECIVEWYEQILGD